MSGDPKTIRGVLLDESGPTAVEYAVLIAMVISVVIAPITVIGFRMQNIVEALRLFLQNTMANSGL